MVGNWLEFSSYGKVLGVIVGLPGVGSQLEDCFSWDYGHLDSGISSFGLQSNRLCSSLVAC